MIIYSDLPWSVIIFTKRGNYLSKYVLDLGTLTTELTDVRQMMVRSLNENCRTHPDIKRFTFPCSNH